MASVERVPVSTHELLTDYSTRGKIKSLIIGWALYAAFLVVTTIPAVNAFLARTKDLAFLASNFRYYFVVLMITGTVITLVKKHPYARINVYPEGLGFVTKEGAETAVDYDKMKLSYGKMQESLIIELRDGKKASYNYAWKEFTQPDVLRNNVERYATLAPA